VLVFHPLRNYTLPLAKESFRDFPLGGWARANGRTGFSGLHPPSIWGWHTGPSVWRNNPYPKFRPHPGVKGVKGGAVWFEGSPERVGEEHGGGALVPLSWFSESLIGYPINPLITELTFPFLTQNSLIRSQLANRGKGKKPRQGYGILVNPTQVRA
jgi:hypothetical protein